MEFSCEPLKQGRESPNNKKNQTDRQPSNSNYHPPASNKSRSLAQVETPVLETFLSPIESIANVLNRHRKQVAKSTFLNKQQADEAAANSATSETETTSVERQSCEEVEEQSQKRGDKKNNNNSNKSTGQQSKPAKGQPKSEQKTTATSSGSKAIKNPQSAAWSGGKLQTAALGSATNSTPVQQPLAGGTLESSQVNQGNSYLYAYNDFISSASSISRRLFSGPSAAKVTKTKREQPPRQRQDNNELEEEDEEEELEEEANKQPRRNNRRKKKNFVENKQQEEDILRAVCLICGKIVSPTQQQTTSTKLANQQKPQVVTGAEEEDDEHGENGEQRESICINGHKHLLQSFVLAAQESSPNSIVTSRPRQNINHHQPRPKKQGARNESTAAANEQQQAILRRDGETLNYIILQQQQLDQAAAVGRRRLLVATGKQLDELDQRSLSDDGQDEEEVLVEDYLHHHQQLARNLNHQDSQKLLLLHQQQQQHSENHLKQYLTLEDSFNSFKAQRQGLIPLPLATANRGPGASTTRRLELGETENEQRQLQQFYLGPQSATNAAAAAYHLSSSSPSSCSTSQNEQLQLQLVQQQQILKQASSRTNLLAPSSTRAIVHGGKMFSPLGASAGAQQQPPPPHATSAQQQAQQQPQFDNPHSRAYYVTSTSQNTDHLHHQLHAQQLGHHHYQQHHLHAPQLHHHHQQQHYPISSDSSLGSSTNAFASSALRLTSGWFRNFCSKKCLFVSCLMMIVFIFILVISLSAYLNYLIQQNRANLQPLSGRLRVDNVLPAPSIGDSTGQQQQLMANKTSPEFLVKQQQFETILRGAFDRTQAQLKSYPNHLVKLEVYSFRPAAAGAVALVANSNNNNDNQPAALLDQSLGLWVYFRLFLNKKSLAQDNQLMRRKSPDEHFDKQFLPRLTQQTLHSGFEQLLSTFAPATSPPVGDSLLAIESSSRTLRNSNTRHSRALPATANSQRSNQQQQQQAVRSFDEQISRLMHFIESIDLQSIQVTPEFDMLSSLPAPAQLPPPVMSDNLRASQPLVPTTTGASIDSSTVRPTSRSNEQLVSSGSSTTTEKSPSAAPTTSSPANGTGATRKFTLQQGYKDTSTRPSVSTSTTSTTRSPTSQRESPFLTNLQQKPTTSRPSAASTTARTLSSGTLRDLANIALSNLGVAVVPQRNDTAHKDKVIHLKSGQPLVSQSGQPVASNNDQFGLTFPAQTTRLQKVTSAPASETSPTTTNLKLVSNSSSVVATTAPSSIEQLWNNALTNRQTNTTVSSTLPPTRENDNENRNGNSGVQPQTRQRLVAVATIGGGGQSNNGANQADQEPSTWHKISVLSQDVANTIRAQMSNGSTPLKPPKVSPHLRHGGSLISTAATGPQTGGRSQQPPLQESAGNNPSAVLLSRDFATVVTTNSNGDNNNDSSPRLLVTSSSNSTLASVVPTPTPTSAQQKQTSNNKLQLQRQRAPATTAAQANHLQNQRNGTTTATTSENHRRKPNIKQQKVQKKVQSNGATNSSSNSGSSSAAELAQKSNDKPIRIVDNFLASIDQQQPTSSRNTGQQRQTTSSRGQLLSAGGSENRTGAQESQVDSNQPTINLVAATLPTTIELTRSTTSSPPRATSASSPSESDDSDAKSSSLTITTTESPVRVSLAPNQTQHQFVVSHQQARPGTSSFSNQWRPLSAHDDHQVNAQNWALRNKTLARQARPTSGGGSQSPFAMSTALLENQNQRRAPAQPQQPQQFANRFTKPPATPLNSVRFAPAQQNDFESHRMSRMHQQHSADQSVNSNNNGGFSTTSTTSSSLNLMDSSTSSNTRIVDDFMITTDKISDTNARASTLLPPLVLSGTAIADQFDLSGPPAPPVLISPAIDLQQPRRTRGPFAFETLRGGGSPSAVSLDETRASLSDASNNQPLNGADFMAETIQSLGRSERSPVNQLINPARLVDQLFRKSQDELDTPLNDNEHDEQKRLVRKRMFLEPAEGLSRSPSTNMMTTLSSLDELPSASSNLSTTLPPDSESFTVSSVEFGNRRGVAPTSSSLVDNSSERKLCKYFGCRAKSSSSGAGEFICLNSTQICDDFIDCQDESDELDCVSLLKLNNRQQHDTNKQLSFSNGAGIIYLNRRGSLAPMCIDYFIEQPGDGLAEPGAVSPPGGRSARLSNSTSSAHDLDAVRLADLARKQQELIRQINTIGQYACSLQSFSRLVSVKINHHDLVDGLDLIKSSKLFHRLSIVDAATSGRQRKSSQFESYKSGHSQDYEVEIFTSSECPSQRTVFVKCGGFECGQDSFSATEHQSQQHQRPTAAPSELAAATTRQPDNALVPSDFPWLVKLYHLDSLACHGYLIDESWLITSSECFSATTTPTMGNNETRSSAMPTALIDGEDKEQDHDIQSARLSGAGWTAEISYEHYGNDDYQSIESNRRRVKDILVRRRGGRAGRGSASDEPNAEGVRNANDNFGFEPSGDDHDERADALAESPIVLAKLEKPVRFSPLNRPICLPQTGAAASNRTQASGDLELDKARGDCVTVTLPLAGRDNNGRRRRRRRRRSSTNFSDDQQIGAGSMSPTQQEQQRAGLSVSRARLARLEDCLARQADASELAGLRSELVCADETELAGAKLNPTNDKNSNQVFATTNNWRANRQRDENSDDDDDVGADDKTRILICSSAAQTSQSGRLRSKWTVVGVQSRRLPAAHKPPRLGANKRLFTSVSSQIDWIVDTMNPTAAKSANKQFDSFTYAPYSNNNNEDEPKAAGSRRRADQQPASCGQFRCSSGECLSWSRICDGLYDCSSHDDEKDCHK